MGLKFTFGWFWTMQCSQTLTRCSKQNWLVTLRLGHLQRPIFALTTLNWSLVRSPELESPSDWSDRSFGSDFASLDHVLWFSAADQGSFWQEEFTLAWNNSDPNEGEGFWRFWSNGSALNVWPAAGAHSVRTILSEYFKFVRNFKSTIVDHEY